MREIWLSIILVLSIAIPLSAPVGAMHMEEDERIYVAGGGYTDGGHSSSPIGTVYIGTMLFDVTSDTNVLVEARDLHAQDVALYVTFHERRNTVDGSLVGGVGETLRAYKVCTKDVLSVPAGAGVMRVVVNSAETVDMVGCQPGFGTMGTVTVQGID